MSLVVGMRNPIWPKPSEMSKREAWGRVRAAVGLSRPLQSVADNGSPSCMILTPKGHRSSFSGQLSSPSGVPVSMEVGPKSPVAKKSRESKPGPKVKPIPIVCGTASNVGAIAMTGQLTSVEMSTVKFTAGYQRSFDELTDWCRRARRSLCLESLDTTLVDYLDLLFHLGKESHDGDKVVAAAVFFIPAVVRKDLVRTQRALKGFRKRRPPLSRLPLVEDVVCGICACLVLLGKRSSAVAIYSMCKLYLRPGEAVKIRVADLGRPMGGHQKGLELFSVTVAPQEVGVPSKTFSFDDTVIVDKPAWLGPMLGELAERRPSSEPLFYQSLGVMKKDWIAACRLLGVQAHEYQLRHAGASIDTLANVRNPSQVGKRGRWKTKKSVDRYAKSGALQKAWRRLSAPTRAWCSQQAREIELLLAGKRVPPPPPKVGKVVNLVR